ncbi:hypothetical protein T484DRAFT_1936711 [Baffinella frigidus]|nr:hypothetical protein T484DRAFT_1936711 [Cryptophyta sp. CCMP2293]
MSRKEGQRLAVVALCAVLTCSLFAGARGLTHGARQRESAPARRTGTVFGGSAAILPHRPSLRLRGGDAMNRQSPRSHAPPRSFENFSFENFSEPAEAFGPFELGVEPICPKDFGAGRQKGGTRPHNDLRSSDRLNRARRYKLSRTVEI